jgi:rare lipoprotein A (peptidoglycan hydrolase)
MPSQAHARTPRAETEPLIPPRGTTHTPPRRTIVVRGRPDDRHRVAPYRHPDPLVSADRRRRPPRAHDRVASRPDRIALWALFMGLVIILVAATTGAAKADPLAQAAAQGQASYARAELGTRTLKQGMRGRDVRTMQRLLSITSDGVFGPDTKRAVKHFQRRAGLEADGIVGRGTRAALIRHRMGSRKATWYGPGLYGNRTACGYTLTEHLRGVAHRSLPCGHPVTLYYNGHCGYTRVVDRGPYAKGVTLDLTAAVAKALGLSGSERLRARY